MGLDEPRERRRGAKLQDKGLDHAAVRSAHCHLVKASGWRWWSLMLLVSRLWAMRGWALPFLTALAASERNHQERGQRPKTLTDCGRARWSWSYGDGCLSAPWWSSPRAVLQS